MTRARPGYIKTTFFLTICALLCVHIFTGQAHAAKPPTSPDLSEPKQPEIPATAEELERAKAVNVTPAPPVVLLKTEQAGYFHKYRKSISLRAGVEWRLSDLQKPGLALGVSYAFPLNDLRGVEAGADLNPEGSGTLHFARREVLGNEAFRWFYKYGLGIKIVGSDQLVTFLRLRNWQVRGGGGFEWSTSQATSFRLDLEPILSTDGINILGTIGVAFSH